MEIGESFVRYNVVSKVCLMIVTEEEQDENSSD